MRKFLWVSALVALAALACENRKEVPEVIQQEDKPMIKVEVLDKTSTHKAPLLFETNQLIKDPDTLLLYVYGIQDKSKLIANVNNQFSFEVDERVEKCPIPLGKGEYIVFLTELDDNGLTKAFPPAINTVHHMNAETTLDTTSPCGWIVGVQERGVGEVLLDYQVCTFSHETSGIVSRIYLDDSFLTEEIGAKNIRISNLTKGTHKVRLELCDSSGNLLKGRFTKVEKTFVIK